MNINPNYLSHHGIKGQRWGVRRFQNEDGTLTPRGEKRYGTVENMNQTRARNKKRMIGIGVGVGVAAAVTGGILLTRKNRQLKQELNTTKGELKDKITQVNYWNKKENQRMANLAKGRETRKANLIKRAADLAAGIDVPKKVKIPPGASVKVTATSKKGALKATEYMSVLGGAIKIPNKGGK